MTTLLGMTLVRALAHTGVAGLLVVSALTGEEKSLSPAQAPASAQTDVLAGHKQYFAGRPADAIKSYQAALRREPEQHEAWLNGAVVWDGLGEPEKAAAWYRRALKAKPGDAPVQAALGELELRRGRLTEAKAELDKALALAPADPLALVARGRTSLAMNRKDEAIGLLKKAAEPSTASPIASFWLGNALEEAGRHEEATAAFDRAARADSFFTGARYRLARSLARVGRVREALDELAKLLDADPAHEDYKRLEAALRPRLKDSPRQTPRPAPPAAWTPPARAADPAVLVAPLPPTGRVPVLRVGVGTTALGKAVDWRGVWVEGSEGFELTEAASGRLIVRGPAAERWELRPTPGKTPGVEALGPNTSLRIRGAVTLKPAGRGVLWLKEKWPGTPGRYRGLERRLRGVVELTPYKQGLKAVNVVDLESYTHGVLSAEMPVDSPMEALKAQAVLARTHALYMRGVTSRHKGDGYELCDGTHCQVYSGVRAESARSRAVVEGTRGRIVTYEGRPTNVLYSANCGGHAQGAGEISGWGSLPYFIGRPDAPAEAGSPWSPWELRQWLRTSPPAFCATSQFTHPSHYRWARVIGVPELETRLDRSLGIGRLQWVQPLRRAKSGHLNSIEVRGSKAKRLVENEIKIRNLFGPGSQRSSLFILDAEYDAKGKPQRYVFYGGGWGHAVGFCQSGAMGRALKGATFAEILRSYYTGVEIGSLRY